MATIQELAKEAYGYFYYTGSENKTKRDNIWLRKDNAPEWVTDMVHSAHGDMFPDDYVVCALTCITELDDAEDTDTLREYANDTVDTYNTELMDWLNSDANRVNYVNDAVAEFGYPGDVMEAIKLGQQFEVEQIFNEVYYYLLNIVDHSESEEN